MTVLSLGPDRRLDVSPADLEEAMKDNSLSERIRLDWSYSPSNGSKSGGDLFAIGTYRN